ncbi:MAG: magnesium/cobalt transporter CorA [Candidatus Altiarchaeota archaeon]|nr:magnesium/cobalt transporter CorA [Candidatus Altiarchaeota archaeon]
MLEKVRRSKKTGLPPGTLVHVGERREDEIRITLLDYDKGNLEEKKVMDIEECSLLKDKPTVSWINIDGIHHVDVIEKLGEKFSLHPLLLEDILNTDQRPKIEDFDDYLFIVLKMLFYDKKEREFRSEQVSMILGPNYVISLQESIGDVFDPVRERIRNGKGRIRCKGPDYLAYSLIDSIVDGYFLILEVLGEEIEDLEDELIHEPDQDTLGQIHRLKRELVLLRRSVWPLREAVNKLEREPSPLIDESTRIYLRDVYDHVIQVIDSIENYREMISGMLDIYLSSVSNRMNEVMKVLTIISTIFIPLTFITGVYGMNFKHMPELGWQYGYPIVWAIMFLTAFSMFLYFRRKRWL